MSALLAFGCAGLGVLAAWEAVGFVGGLGARAMSVAAPLRTGRPPRPIERLRLTVTATLTLLAGAWLIGGPLLAAFAGAGGPYAVRRMLAVARERRRRCMIASAPAAARAIADALAAGRSIVAAIAVAADEVREARVREELGRVVRGLEAGEQLEIALQRLCEEVDDATYDAMAAAILLQRDAGGDLAGLLRKMAATFEERERAVADARSLTAQARYSAGIVICLPMAAVVLAELAAPGSLRAVLGEPTSAALVAASAAFQLLGWAAIRRVAIVAR